ncbi:MAG: 2-hydroxyacid dehydrogenase, partial [Pseudomonadota bacterium]
MSKHQILMTGTLLDELGLRLDDDFEVHRVHSIADAGDLLQEVGQRIIGISHGGHGPTIDGAAMDRLPNLKLIANFGVGYDTVDAAEAGRRGVIVTNTPDVLSEEVADTALALLLMTTRELGRAEQWVRQGHWANKGAYRLTPLTLRGRSVGIAGLGRIGRAIAHRCEAFGLPVSYFGRTKKDDVPYPFYTDLVEMAAAVDTMILVTPGTAETQDMVNADVLAALGANGVLINIARGSVVDETALIEALRANTIAAAGLDVMKN